MEPVYKGQSLMKLHGSVVEAQLCNFKVMSSNPGWWKAILKIVPSMRFELMTYRLPSPHSSIELQSHIASVQLKYGLQSKMLLNMTDCPEIRLNAFGSRLNAYWTRSKRKRRKQPYVTGI